MTSNDLMLAVDGGATKTDMILFHEDGRIVNRVIGGSSNSTDIGFEYSAQTLRSLFEKLLAGRGGMSAPLLSVYTGIAGGSVGENKLRYRQLLERHFPSASHISNGSDAVNALNTGVRMGDGMVLVAGTGSVVLARKSGVIHQVGGWGHLLGDEGSGYDIGRMGLRRVLQELDGRETTTVMTERFGKKIGMQINQAIPEIYKGGKQLIASFAPLVFESAADGDEAAAKILERSANELVQLLFTGCRFLETAPYRVVFVGGLWNGSGSMLKNLVLKQLDERFICIKPEFSPVYGSAVEAMKEAGFRITPEFDNNFRKTWGRFSASPMD